MTWFNFTSNRWMDIVLPPVCLLCGASGENNRDLCAGCSADLPRNLRACPQCALPVPLSRLGPCVSCQRHPPIYHRAFAPFRYQPPLDFLILGLKFSGRLNHARLLGCLLAEALVERGGPWPDILIPVPLHPRRLRERGFNQALELARPAARQLGIPLCPRGLHRVRDTIPQTQLDARARRTNLLGAFAVGESVAGSRVALLDDVMTTASTVSECARVLQAGGAEDIEVWVIGRAGETEDAVIGTEAR